MGLRTAFEERVLPEKRTSYIDCTAGRTEQKPSPPYAALCLTPIAPGIGARMVEKEDKDMNCEAPNQALEHNSA